MRVLTVRQPWAWAIIHGGKDVENRSRSLGPYRGPVAIHAGLAEDGLAFGDEQMYKAIYRAGRRYNEGALDGINIRGRIIGVVDLVDVHPCQWSDCCPCSPWAMSDHHHLALEDPRPLARPIPAKGRLGLWRPDAALEAAIREQIGEA